MLNPKYSYIFNAKLEGNRFHHLLKNYKLMMKTRNAYILTKKQKTFISAFRTLKLNLENKSKTKGNLSFLKSIVNSTNSLKKKQKQEEKKGLFETNLNIVLNNDVNFKKKKRFFQVNYARYLLFLNGKLSLHTYPSNNYIFQFLPRVKKLFKEYFNLVLNRRIKLNKQKQDYEYDVVPLVNLLKVKQKFQYITKSFMKGCRVFFKYTGSNMFGTITNNLGEVLFSYSAGIFKNTRTRKEKTTIFIAKQLGELIALRLYKSNATEIIFLPFMNHRKARTLMRFLSSGFRLVRFFELSKFFVIRKVMRNGVRLRKIARK